MKSFDEWMREYGESHQNSVNQKIHKVCVPLIMLTVLGFLWSLPVPNLFLDVPFLNWATLFLGLCLSYYLFLNFKMFIGMFIQTFIMVMICDQLAQREILLSFSIIVFILAWIGQFWGHKIEGKKPSFFKDILFLLIGPLWVTRFLYEKLGIKI